MLDDGVYTLPYFHKDCNKKDCNDKKRSVIMEKINHNGKRLIIIEKDLR